MVVLVGLYIFFIRCLPQLIIPSPLILPRRLLAQAFKVIGILQPPLLLIEKLALALTSRI